MRAAYDEEQAAIARLRSAAQLAAEHGSVALLRRCEHDLGTRSVRFPPGRSSDGVAPSGPAERSANAALLNFGAYLTTHPKGAT